MAVNRYLQARLERGGFSPVRHLGMALWLTVHALAGVPPLLVSHLLARRRVIEALFEIALRPVPVLTVLAALLGSAVAFSAALVLGVIDVDTVLLDGLRHVITRDIAPLLVGIFVAGRSGVALTVRIRRMAQGGEVDALRLMGEDPSRYVLSPALLGFFAAATALFIWAVFIAHFSAALVLDHLHAVTVGRYRALVVGAIHDDIWYGLIRSEVYGALAFLVAAYQGSRAASGRDSLEESSGRTFVWSLIFIFAAEAVFSGLKM